jgi:hypothetical protein
VICQAVTAQHKERCHKGLTVERRWQRGLECSSGIKHQGASRQLRLRKERTSGRVFRKTIELEIRKWIVGSSTWLRKWVTGHCGGIPPPPEWKKRHQKHSRRKPRMKVMVVHLALWGNRSGQAALRREQLENNHRGNQAMGKKGDVDHRHHKHSPQERRNGGTSVGYLGWIAVGREQCGM